MSSYRRRSGGEERDDESDFRYVSSGGTLSYLSMLSMVQDSGTKPSRHFQSSRENRCNVHRYQDRSTMGNTGPSDQAGTSGVRERLPRVILQAGHT